MALPQQKFREMVFQLLYSLDVGGAEESNLIPLIMKELSVTKKAVLEALDKVQDIRNNQQAIDQAIAGTSRSYEFERIQSVERNILRVGIYELLYDSQIPPKVAISESMRLARKFGTPESAAYVNAVLDNLYKGSLGLNVDEEVIANKAKELIRSEEIAKEASEQPPVENSQD